MSITVTPNPTATPPNFGIVITSSDGSTITAASLTVTASGATTPTRVQPAAGPSPRTVAFYEAPWDTPVVFTAVITSAAGTETFTSTAVTLTSALPWLIHPTTPALSRPLDSGVATAAGVAQHGAVTRSANTVAHDILGSPYRVITKTGPRSASRTSLQVTTVTALEAQSILALLDDQTPILIRVPAAWGWDWEDGYYDIGEVSFDRLVQYGADHSRRFTLPLERVDVPAGTQQATRTYADVLAGFATYAAVRAAYASYTNLLTDTRS